MSRVIEIVVTDEQWEALENFKPGMGTIPDAQDVTPEEAAQLLFRMALEPFVWLETQKKDMELLETVKGDPEMLQTVNDKVTQAREKLTRETVVEPTPETPTVEEITIQQQ